MSGSGTTGSGPSEAERQRMWQVMDFPYLPGLPYPHTRLYVQALEEIYVNGSVEFSTFEIPENAVFDAYSERQAFHEMGFFETFWSAPSVHALFPFRLKPKIDTSAPDVFVKIEHSALGEALGAALARGGAYQVHAGGDQDAQAKGEAAANELIGESGDQVYVYMCELPWCDFFWDVLWDITWVVIDMKQRRIHLICTTDSD